MSCTQKQQLVSFPKVRIWKPWFRHFNDHKDFHNEGTVHLFSLMALFSYANFRSNERVLNGERYMEAPGQWICKLGSLPRILRVHSKGQALEQLEYFQTHGFLTYECVDKKNEIIRFTIANWKEHCGDRHRVDRAFSDELLQIWTNGRLRISFTGMKSSACGICFFRLDASL